MNFCPISRFFRFSRHEYGSWTDHCADNRGQKPFSTVNFDIVKTIVKTSFLQKPHENIAESFPFSRKNPQRIGKKPVKNFWRLCSNGATKPLYWTPLTFWGTSVPKPVELLVNTARPIRLLTFGSVVSTGRLPKHRLREISTAFGIKSAYEPPPVTADACRYRLCGHLSDESKKVISRGVLQ